MRGFHTTMFVLLLAVFSTQTLRHVYVKWLEPRTSVLDRFPEPVEEQILASEDLDELVKQYEQARAKKKAFDEGHSDRDVRAAREAGRPVYGDEMQLRAAIQRLEDQDRDRFRLWFYWSAGLASVLLGLAAARWWDRWIGSVAVVTGFVEMAVWTSPLFRSWGPQARFEHLLTTKLALSAGSLALLLLVWLLRRRTQGPGATLTSGV